MKKRHRAARGFTLIELLVVVAIVTVLAGLVVPAVNHALKLATALSCVNNLRGLGAALYTYRINSNGYLPACGSSEYNGTLGYERSGDPSEFWYKALAPLVDVDPDYLDDLEDNDDRREQNPFRWEKSKEEQTAGIFACPTKKGCVLGYGMNWRVLDQGKETTYLWDRESHVAFDIIKNPSATIILSDCGIVENGPDKSTDIREWEDEDPLEAPYHGKCEWPDRDGNFNQVTDKPEGYWVPVPRHVGETVCVLYLDGGAERLELRELINYPDCKPVCYGDTNCLWDNDQIRREDEE